MYTIVLYLLYFPLIIYIVLSLLIALFSNAVFVQISNCILIYMEKKKGTLILTVCLESHGENGELRMCPQISRGAVKEQTRLSRSSDIFPVLQATVNCLRGP